MAVRRGTVTRSAVCTVNDLERRIISAKSMLVLKVSTDLVYLCKSECRLASRGASCVAADAEIGPLVQVGSKSVNSLYSFTALIHRLSPLTDAIAAET